MLDDDGEEFDCCLLSWLIDADWFRLLCIKVRLRRESMSIRSYKYELFLTIV